MTAATEIEGEQTKTEDNLDLDLKVQPWTPGPDAVDITPDQDGGVLKEIKKEGTGQDGPLPWDKVSVHYVGTLTDGTVFDSSRERGELFEFSLGKGKVIKAWDIGVATMKKGEVSMFYCKPEYAYGSTGSGAKIPPDATLIFEVELFSWKGEDLSPNKDGGIIRRQIQKGEGMSNPNDGATVEVHLVGKCNGTVFEERDVSFVLGEGSEFAIVEGVEKALESLKKGEKSLVELTPQYAFGPEGKPDLGVPPDACVQYEVTLVNFEKAKDTWDFDDGEKIDQANFYKTKGTNFFKGGKYKLAEKQYLKIVEFMEFGGNKIEDALETRKNQLLLAAHLNLAMTYLKMEDSLKAEDSCNKALEIDSNSEKGLFRRGMALMGRNEMDAAKLDFQAVLAVDPGNKAAANQLIVCNGKLRQQRERDRQIYGNMFNKFAEQDAKRDPNAHRGDVLQNPGTWQGQGQGDEYEKMDMEKVDSFTEAVNSKHLEMLP